MTPSIHPSPCLAFPFGLALESCVSLALSKGGCEYSKYLMEERPPEVLPLSTHWPLAARISSVIGSFQKMKSEPVVSTRSGGPPLGRGF
jgi:hypothetical protein